MALIRQIDAAFQPCAECQLLWMIQRRIVQHDGVKRIADLKAADFAEETAAAEGGKIECLIDRKRLDLLIKQTPTELRRTDRPCHHLEHILRIAACDI